MRVVFVLIQRVFILEMKYYFFNRNLEYDFKYYLNNESGDGVLLYELINWLLGNFQEEI